MSPPVCTHRREIALKRVACPRGQHQAREPTRPAQNQCTFGFCEGLVSRKESALIFVIPCLLLGNQELRPNGSFEGALPLDRTGPLGDGQLSSGQIAATGGGPAPRGAITIIRRKRRWSFEKPAVKFGPKKQSTTISVLRHC